MRIAGAAADQRERQELERILLLSEYVKRIHSLAAQAQPPTSAAPSVSLESSPASRPRPRPGPALRPAPSAIHWWP